MKEETNHRLKCRLYPGMFSDERVVEYTLPDGTDVSFVVPQSLVQDEGHGRGSIAVSVLRRAEEKWAVLPTPSRDMIVVDERDLVVA